MTFAEAREIVKKYKPTADTCTEFMDAYMFSCSTDPLSEGGRGPVVIMKDTDEVISDCIYYTDKMESGEKAIMLREFKL